MTSDNRTNEEWAARVDSETLAAMLSTGLPADHPAVVAALAEWDRRFFDPYRADRTDTAV